MVVSLMLLLHSRFGNHLNVSIIVSIVWVYVCDGESQANILLDKRPRGKSKVSGGVFQGAPAGSQFQHRVEAGKD